MQAPKHATSKLSKRFATALIVIAIISGGSGIDEAALGQESNPVKASAIHKQALVYLKAGRINEGIALLNRAAAYDPSDATIYFNLGASYGMLKQYPKAWQAFRRSVALDPARSETWIALAKSYAACGDNKQATSILVDVQRRFPNNLEAQKECNTLLATIAGGSKVGLVSAANVVRSDPTSLDAWIQLSNSYSRQNKYSEALATLEKARSRFNSDKRYHLALAFVYKDMKKYGDAAKEFMEAAKIDTTDPKLLESAMWCLVQQGDLDGVQATRKLFVQRYPNLKETKEMSDAIKYYEDDFASTKKADGAKQASSMRRSFDSDDMPLKVYVHDRLKGRTVWDAKSTKSGDINYSLFIERAMQDWSNASGRKITFTFCNNPEDANIECNWTSDRSQLDMTFASGVTSYTRNSKGQSKARIKLLAKAPGFDLTESEFYQCCLHELGHALGLSHSASPSDIMYFSGSVATNNKGLSSSDISRLKNLYADM